MKKISSFLRNFFILILLSSFSIRATAQIKGNHIIGEQIRKITGFQAVTSNGPVDVYVKQGDRCSVVVRADENLIPYIKTTVKNNTLVVSLNKSIREAKRLEVIVTMKNLKKVTLSGSGDFYCKTPFRTPAISFVVTGSGDVKATLQSRSVDVHLSGSGDVELQGVHGRLIAEITGSGDLEASGLQLENCSVKLMGSGDVELDGRAETFSVITSGSGDIDAGRLTAVKVLVKSNGSGDISVHAANRLEAALSGSGDLHYSGNPTVLKVSALGSGDVYHH
jgi:hypothetical protein